MHWNARHRMPFHSLRIHLGEYISNPGVGPLFPSFTYQGEDLDMLDAFACELPRDPAFDNYPISSYMRSDRLHNANADKNLVVVRSVELQSHP